MCYAFGTQQCPSVLPGMTACADRVPAPKYVLEEQEDMRSSTIANVGINGEDKVVKQCATVLAAVHYCKCWDKW